MQTKQTLQHEYLDNSLSDLLFPVERNSVLLRIPNKGRTMFCFWGKTDARNKSTCYGIVFVIVVNSFVMPVFVRAKTQIKHRVWEARINTYWGYSTTLMKTAGKSRASFNSSTVARLGFYHVALDELSVIWGLAEKMVRYVEQKARAISSDWKLFDQLRCKENFISWVALWHLVWRS